MYLQAKWSNKSEDFLQNYNKMEDFLQNYNKDDQGGFKFHLQAKRRIGNAKSWISNVRPRCTVTDPSGKEWSEWKEPYLQN